MPIVGFGDKRFELGAKKFERHIISEVKRVIKETAEMIVTQAKALAPVDEGNLRDSIDVRYINGGLSAYIHVGAEYAVYVEFGTGIYAVKGNGRKDPWVYYSEKLGKFVFTRGMEAQPFWFPSLDVAEKHFRREMKKLG